MWQESSHPKVADTLSDDSVFSVKVIMADNDNHTRWEISESLADSSIASINPSATFLNPQQLATIMSRY